jgi:D-proline reductase (dithiol) PrdB
VGLVARHLEANGIPTVTFSCARDITEAARPPRSVFLD